MAKVALYNLSISFLDKYVKDAGLPFKSVAVVYDNKYEDPAVGRFYQEVLVPIEEDMFLNCETYYQQYIGETENTSLNERLETLQSLTNDDVAKITEKGIGSKIEMLRQTETFLLDQLGLKKERVQTSWLWSDDHDKALIATILRMTREELNKFVLLYINEKLFDPEGKPAHSDDLIGDFIRQIVLRTGWSRGDIFIHYELNKLAKERFDRLADSSCFTPLKNQLSLAMADEEVKLFTPKGRTRIATSEKEALDGIREPSTPSPRHLTIAITPMVAGKRAAPSIPPLFSGTPSNTISGPHTPETIASITPGTIGTPIEPFSTLSTESADLSFIDGLTGPAALRLAVPKPSMVDKEPSSSPIAATAETKMIRALNPLLSLGKAVAATKQTSRTGVEVKVEEWCPQKTEPKPPISKDEAARIRIAATQKSPTATNVKPPIPVAKRPAISPIARPVTTAPILATYKGARVETPVKANISVPGIPKPATTWTIHYNAAREADAAIRAIGGESKP